MNNNPPSSNAGPGGGSAWQPPSLAEMQALLPGFQFTALLGRGGMGAVYRAVQLSLNRPVAIKALSAELLADEEANFAERFRKEALTMARLSHPGIVGVYESGQVGGLLYIVMEFVDGSDVGRMIHSEGRLAPKHVTSILTQVCEALHYAHQQGVIHRDLKPANLLVTRDGRVKIADFGLAKHNDDALLALTKTNVAIGTPDFLAPEAWTPGTALDARADLYSLGVTLYQMLTGEIPRGLWKMPSIKSGIDARFDAIIDRAMQPDREARYQSTAEIRRDLEQIEAGAAVPPASYSRATFAVVVAAAGVIGIILIWWLNVRDTSGVHTPPEVREAARWLVKQKAHFRVLNNGKELEVKSEADIPQGDFEIVYLLFDRWESSPPKPPPPDAEFNRLQAVKTLRTAWLRLPGLSDAAFAFLADNPNLTGVSIEEGSDVTDAVLAHLSGLKKLESLSITHARGFTGRGMTNSAWLPALQFCDFLHTKLNDEGCRALARCPQLAQVRIDGTAVTGEGLRALSQIRTLTHLSAGNCSNITASDFAMLLPEFKGLQNLELRHAAFADEDAVAVATLTNLTQLYLFSDKLTDAGLARLSNLDRLRHLYVGDTSVTAGGIAAFAKLRPGCEIEK